jgi:hypothetical protein
VLDDGIAHGLWQGLDASTFFERLAACLDLLGTDFAIPVGVQALKDGSARAAVLPVWGLTQKWA